MGWRTKDAPNLYSFYRVGLGNLEKRYVATAVISQTPFLLSIIRPLGYSWGSAVRYGISGSSRELSRMSETDGIVGQRALDSVFTLLD